MNPNENQSMQPDMPQAEPMQHNQFMPSQDQSMQSQAQPVQSQPENQPYSQSEPQQPQVEQPQVTPDFQTQTDQSQATTSPTYQTPALDQAATQQIAQPVNPGKTMGLVGFVMSLFGLSLLAIIFGAIGLKKSKQAGMGNGLALAAIILGVIELILQTLFIIIIIAGASGAFN